MLESLFNFEYCKIFKSTYFEEQLQTAAFENVFKIIHKEISLFIKKKQQWMSSPSRKWIWNRFKIKSYCICDWCELGEIGGGRSSKIPLCNHSGGNLLDRVVKYQRWSSSAKKVNNLNTLTVSSLYHRPLIGF